MSSCNVGQCESMISIRTVSCLSYVPDEIKKDEKGIPDLQMSGLVLSVTLITVLSACLS